MQIAMIGLGRMGANMASSRGEADYQDKLLSAMRYQFGGHVEVQTGERAA